MEKYRKWTDQATGINPFIQVKPKKLNIFLRIIMFIFAILKLILWIPLRYIILLCMILSIILPLRFIKIYIIQIPIKIMLLLLSVYSKDEYSFNRVIQRATKINKSIIVLSNSSSIIDSFYYLSTISPVSFILTHKYQNPDSKGQYYSYQVYGFFKLLYKITTQKQPFFVYHKGQKKSDQYVCNQSSLEQIIKIGKQKGQNRVLYYEGIKTNGLGTIKPCKTLTQKLYNSQVNIVMSQIKINSSTQVNCMVIHPFLMILRLMRSPSVSLKVRAKLIQFDKINSKNQMHNDIQDFIKASSKLLQTEPQSYFDFLEYFYENRK